MFECVLQKHQWMHQQNLTADVKQAFDENDKSVEQPTIYAEKSSVEDQILMLERSQIPKLPQMSSHQPAANIPTICNTTETEFSEVSGQKNTVVEQKTMQAAEWAGNSTDDAVPFGANETTLFCGYTG